MEFIDDVGVIDEIIRKEQPKLWKAVHHHYASLSIWACIKAKDWTWARKHFEFKCEI